MVYQKGRNRTNFGGRSIHNGTQSSWLFSFYPFVWFRMGGDKVIKCLWHKISVFPNLMEITNIKRNNLTGANAFQYIGLLIIHELVRSCKFFKRRRIHVVQCGFIKHMVMLIFLWKPWLLSENRGTNNSPMTGGRVEWLSKCICKIYAVKWKYKKD